MDFQKILEYQIWGNSGETYLRAVLIFIGALAVFKIFQFLIIKKIENITKKTKTDIDDFLISLVKGVKPPFYFFLSLYIALRFIKIHQTLGLIFDRAIYIVIALQIVLILQKAIDFSAKKIVNKMTDENADEKERLEEEAVVETVAKVIKFILWVIAVLLLLANMGVNVTSAVAGMGIGGIAVAMAAKDILSDIIAAISIYLDKPFRVGQRIQVGTDTGTVEHIGIKTTRLKTPQGQELVVSNRDMTGARIQNFKKMEKRRVKFLLGVVYGLSAEKLEQIPLFIKEIIDSVDGAEFERSHFNAYGDFSLNFETVYYSSTQYEEHMDIQQKVYLAIYKKFEEEKIEFAYPTQTIFLEKTQNEDTGRGDKQL